MSAPPAPSLVFTSVFVFSVVVTGFIFRTLEARPLAERRVQRWGRSGAGPVMSNASVALFAGFFTLFLLTAALNAFGLRTGGPEAPWGIGLALVAVIVSGFRDSRFEKKGLTRR
jgi:hypothetical protein